METIAIAGGLIGAGNYINNNYGRVRNVSGDTLLRGNRVPVNENIYQNSPSSMANNVERQHIQKNWNRATDTYNTNVVPRNFNQKIFSDQTQNTANRFPFRPETTRKTNHRTEETFIDINEYKAEPVNSLCGVNIPPEKFTHNNMQPFFGGRVKQNTYINANQPVLELFTGTSSYDIKKEEIGPLFKPQKNMGNQYGTSVYSDEINDRYVPSKFRQGEKPIQQIMVGPGLNKGYTAEPSGGFHQADTTQYVMPRNVDELRIKTNPKVTYSGVMLTGKGPTQRGLQGTHNKNRPETDYVNSPSRYFTTVGSFTKPVQNPKFVNKITNRQDTHEAYTGGAGPVHSKPQMEQSYKPSDKQQLGNSGFRNPNVQFAKNVTDYGKDNYSINETERDTTQNNSYLSSAVSMVKALIAPIEDIMKTTKKENFIGNNRQAGNVQMHVSKLPVHDPSDIARTTLKETNIDNTRQGNVGGLDRRGGVVYDPNDIARTTIKETNIDNNRQGNIGGLDSRGGVVYDPNDIARTTIKETNIDNNRQGNVGGLDHRGGVVYDPNDIARTTIKETNIDNNRQGNVAGISRAGLVYDPNDIARTTIKETNIDNTRQGNVAGISRAGFVYDPNDIARTTIKETNIDNTRQGNVGGLGKGGVARDPNDVARTTLKETNIDNRSSGFLVGPKRCVVYDPNDIARTTIKETNIENNRHGNVTGLGRIGGVIYDPNNIARTTIKETNIDNTRQGNVGSFDKRGIVYDPNETAKPTVRETLDNDDPHRNLSGLKHGFVYDPNNVAKATMKETLIDNNHTGNVGGNDMGLGYTTNPKVAPVTIRQTTEDNKYIGEATGPERGAYQVTEYDAKETQKEQLSNNSYTGNAKNEHSAHMSYEDIYNAEMNIYKEIVAVGREPTQTSTKQSVSMNDINLDVKKIETDVYNERENVVTKIIDLGPEREDGCTITREKSRYDELGLERIDPAYLSAFHENPFTKPLNSMA